MKSRPLNPKGGNDRIYTPPELAGQIIAHFNPRGAICEPCRGVAPYPFWREGWFHYEIDEGADFLLRPSAADYDWIVTNPPWSKFRPFLQQAMRVSENIIFLAPSNHWALKARRRDMREARFGFREVLEVDTPPTPWPQSGFQLAATWIQHGYTGPCRFSHL